MVRVRRVATVRRRRKRRKGRAYGEGRVEREVTGSPLKKKAVAIRVPAKSLFLVIIGVSGRSDGV